jgi:alkyl sulfatase BDS1-like metallo-beta-lactamase superfamily hydrolase
MASNAALELADALWRGEARIEDHHPVGYLGELAEVAEGVAFVPSFANVVAFATGDGLLLVDTGSAMLAQHIHEQVRGWSEDPVHTVVYTHGHIDHVMGMPLWDAEADDAGRDRPRVVAHEAILARFDRYRLTAGYNAAINRRQFQVEELEWPTDYRVPDETYRDELAVEVGGERFECHHARGETDDHTWVWAPERRVLCTGDFFIWAAPNAGNPQKAQRHPRDWAGALREMAALGAEALLPGHGLPVVGADRVRQALEDTAALLESIVEQTLALMNEGASLDAVLAGVRPPAELLERPYLRPVYDEPEFVVRNLWRLYGGWYDGDPATLKPARAADLAAELAALAGGAQRLADRARELAEAGDLRLAGHLAQLAGQAAPDDAAIQSARAEVFERRAAAEASTMARGVFAGAAAEARKRA